MEIGNHRLRFPIKTNEIIEMEIQNKQGYKQTEVGLIPEDWEVITLSEVFDFKNGLNKEKKFFGSGTPIVNYMDVYKRNGIKGVDLAGRVTLTGQEIRNFEVRKGDVFFTRTSETIEEIGVAAVLLEDVTDTVFSGFVLRARPKNERLNLEFRKYCFSSSFVRKEITSKSSYTTRALTNGRLLSEVKLPLPPLPEQTAIASALSDMDALIAQTEKLIEKKKAIKQGVMQELLKPKEGWVKRKLGEVSEIIMGQSPLSVNYNANGLGLPLVQGNADILDRKAIIRFHTSQITKKGKAGDVIMTVRAPVGEIAITDFDCCLGRGVCAIRYENQFLYHFLISIENYWKKLSSGSTFDSVNSSQIKDLEISIPSDKEEQIRISNILTDMDNELLSWETKLQKLKLQKQGMMQVLLTGKIRLV